MMERPPIPDEAPLEGYQFAPNREQYGHDFMRGLAESLIVGGAIGAYTGVKLYNATGDTNASVRHGWENTKYSWAISGWGFIAAVFGLATLGLAATGGLFTASGLLIVPLFVLPLYLFILNVGRFRQYNRAVWSQVLPQPASPPDQVIEARLAETVAHKAARLRPIGPHSAWPRQY